MQISRPSASEHAAFMGTYVDATARALAAQGSDDLLMLLGDQPAQLRAALQGVDPTLGSFAYAPGKWTLAESLLHVADTERVFSYRMVRIARGDMTPLPGFDQDAWVPQSRAENRALDDIVDEVAAVRTSTLALVQSLDTTAIAQLGTASNNPLSVRALTWVIPGHFAHHLALTHTRYLAAANAR